MLRHHFVAATSSPFRFHITHVINHFEYANYIFSVLSLYCLLSVCFMFLFETGRLLLNSE